jgi:hypothetical protein
MSLITVQDAKGWVQTGKLTITELDTDLLDQIEAEVLGRIAATYAITTWTTPSTTPRLVRVAIAKLYVCYLYMRVYSEDEDGTPSYSYNLRMNAEMLITGIVDGTITLPEVDPATNTAGDPVYYPSDASSAYEPGDMGDWSLGDAKFSMGKVF